MKKIILSLLAMIIVEVISFTYPKLAGAHMTEGSSSGSNGMMGWGMMETGMMGNWGSGGGNAFSQVWWLIIVIAQAIFLFLLGLLLLVAIRYLWKKGNKK